MCKLIDNLIPISGRNCLYSSIAALMQYYGCSLSEAELFFLCEGFEYQYISSQKENLQKPSQKYVYRSMKEIGIHLQRFMQMDYVSGSGLMDNDDFELVCKGIHNKNPVVIMLNPDILQYTQREYQPDGEHELHCIILHGIDIEENKAYIIDSFVVNNSGLVSSFQGEIPLDIVRVHTKGYLLLQIYAFEQISRDLIKETMCGALEKFLLARNVNHNLTGWKALCKGIEKIRLLQNAEKEFAAVYCLELSYLLRAHFLFVFDYILEIFTSYEFGISASLESRIKHCRYEWSRYCMKIWKVSFAPDIQPFIQLANYGMELMESLKQIIKSIIVHLQKEEAYSQD